MRLLSRFARIANLPETRAQADPGSEDSGGERNDPSAAADAQDSTSVESHLLKTVGWISAALGAVALGLLVGREIRVRYKFNRRTPYDAYAHSGDELGDVDWGVGI